eukprot:240341-Chlamydomonas_euryale.AAC.21
MVGYQALSFQAAVYKDACLNQRHDVFVMPLPSSLTSPPLPLSLPSSLPSSPYNSLRLAASRSPSQ